MAGKYVALTTRLEANGFAEFEMTFAQIEAVIGSPLPKSANTPQFWANTVEYQQPQRKAIAAADHEAFLVAGSRRVRFKRVR
jgi:hypothetical protein